MFRLNLNELRAKQTKFVMRNKTPKHIGIIPDGNRRWAREKNLPAFEGHRRGLETFKKIGRAVWKRGIKVLTVWAFSTENWDRSKTEITYLMKLFNWVLSGKSVEEYHKMGIKIKIIGQKEKFPRSLQKKIKEAEELTQNNKKGVLNLALSYGGRPEIVEAVKKIVKKEVPAETISEDLINKNLWTEGCSDPDLIIRTGGHCRLSGFLPWQSVYSELYFLNKHWPDFSEKDLEKALDYYSLCQRNFGK